MRKLTRERKKIQVTKKEKYCFLDVPKSQIKLLPERLIKGSQTNWNNNDTKGFFANMLLRKMSVKWLWSNDMQVVTNYGAFYRISTNSGSRKCRIAVLSAASTCRWTSLRHLLWRTLLCKTTSLPKTRIRSVADFREMIKQMMKQQEEARPSHRLGWKHGDYTTRWFRPYLHILYNVQSLVCNNNCIYVTIYLLYYCNRYTVLLSTRLRWLLYLYF